MSDASLLPGAVLPAERETHRDRKSGLPVTRYTAGRGHSNHCYFNVDGSWDGGQRIVIHREVDNGGELFSLDLERGEFVRLTRSASGETVSHATASSVSSAREEAYFWSQGGLWAVHLRSCERRLVARMPDGFRGENTAVTCDHSAVLTVLTAHSERGQPQLTTEQRRESYNHPQEGRVVAIDLDNGAITTLHRSSSHTLGHANPSPTDPDLLTFCHEGPWLEIDQRIWGLRRSGGEPWPIVPRDPDWGVGHEFWLADGTTLGYHARYREGSWRHALGWARADGSGAFQAEITVPTHHAHARHPDRYVLDGTRTSGDFLFVIAPDEAGWSAPRILCAHDSSRWHQAAHAHQHVCADGRTVLFCSDRRRYCDVYAVTMPEDLERLPLYEGPPYRYYWE